MAKFNGKDKNNALLEAIEKNIKRLLTTSSHADESLLTTVDGVKVLEDEKEKYKKLKEIFAILDFTGKDEKDLFSFEQILLPKEKQEKLFKLVNDPEVVSLSKSTECPLVFPSVFGQFGEIPGLNGVRCPRPKSDFETVEEYEKFLAAHYEKFGIKANEAEPGLRQAYPHEKLIWDKGQAQLPPTSDYRSKYYTDLKNKYEQKKKAGKPELTEEEQEAVRKKAEERKLNREKLNRRVYPKQRRTLKEYISGFGAKIKEKNKALTSSENWPKIKKFLIGAAITVGAVALLNVVAPGLMSSLLAGLVNWPQMLGYALTGTATTSSGGIIALSIGERLAMGLVGAAVPAGIISVIRKLAKKKKEEPVIEEPPKGPTGGDGDDNGDDDEEKGKDKGKGKAKGNGEGTEDEEEEEITLPEGSLEDKVKFVQTALKKINDEITDIETQLTALRENPTNNTEQVEATLKQLRDRINKLKKNRDKYLAALATLVSEEEFKKATEGPEIKPQTGGMKL